MTADQTKRQRLVAAATRLTVADVRNLAGQIDEAIDDSAKLIGDAIRVDGYKLSPAESCQLVFAATLRNTLLGHNAEILRQSWWFIQRYANELLAVHSQNPSPLTITLMDRSWLGLGTLPPVYIGSKSEVRPALTRPVERLTFDLVELYQRFLESTPYYREELPCPSSAALNGESLVKR